MPTSVYGLSSSDMQANTIVESLKHAGFRVDDIAGLFPSKSAAQESSAVSDAQSPEAVGMGGVVGGALGWMVGIGMLAIPGLGPFIAAGPIMAALCCAAIGAAVGGLTGTLLGLGMTEYEAQRYAEKLRAGHILLTVHVENHDLAERAAKILRDGGADDINLAAADGIRAKSIAG